MSKRSDLQALTPGLRRYARGLTGDAMIADDLTQDAVLSALRSAGMGRGPALRRRLYAILTDFNRIRTAGLAEHEAYRADALSEEPDPLSQLTLPEREALLLVAVEQFDYEDAAEIAGVTRTALIARLAEARSPKDAATPGAGRRMHLRVVVS